MAILYFPTTGTDSDAASADRAAATGAYRSPPPCERTAPHSSRDRHGHFWPCHTRFTARRLVHPPPPHFLTHAFTASLTNWFFRLPQATSSSASNGGPTHELHNLSHCRSDEACFFCVNRPHRQICLKRPLRHHSEGTLMGSTSSINVG